MDNDEERIGDLNGPYARSFKLLMATWKWIFATVGTLLLIGTGIMMDIRQTLAVQGQRIETIDARVSTAKIMGHYLRDRIAEHTQDGHPDSVMDVNDRQDKAIDEIRRGIQ